jgi:pimeloyl-ACP methyl ester carboxylesterase
VAPDLRGAGQSDKPPEVAAYRAECFVEDVVAIGRAFGRETLALVGHDVGGGLAWATAMLHPELVTHLAILNSVHPVGFARQMRHLSQIRRSWYIFLFQVPVLPEWIAGTGDLGLLRKALKGDGLSAEATDDLLAAIRAPGALHATINWYRASVRSALLESSRSVPVSVPSLIVWGDRERYLDAALAEPPADFVSNTRVVHLPEAGHWVMLDAPTQVNELLVRHLRGAGSAG